CLVKADVALASPPDDALQMQAPFARDRLVAELTRNLSTHFNLEGDLQLDLLRPWTPPARLASDWAVDILEYPAVASSTMMLRCRILADGTSGAETSFVVRAQLWRDSWVARQPLRLGATFDPSQL